jgi:hypothetical protein
MNQFFLHITSGGGIPAAGQHSSGQSGEHVRAIFPIPANITTLKHMAHNLIRKAPGKDSLRLKRKAAAWDDEFLVSLVAA